MNPREQPEVGERADIPPNGEFGDAERGREIGDLYGPRMTQSGKDALTSFEGEDGRRRTTFAAVPGRERVDHAPPNDGVRMRSSRSSAFGTISQRGWTS
jgi:hypothetical protein